MVLFLEVKLINLAFVLCEKPKQRGMCWNISEAVKLQS